VHDLLLTDAGAEAEAPGPRTETPGASRGRGPVASTSCLVIVLSAAFLVLIVLPAVVWTAGIACGAQ
jgi:hypothetical protein